MIKVGIVGASGYSGEELVRILANHPHVELTCVTSRTLQGTPVEKVIPLLRNRLGKLTFSSSDPQALATGSEADLFFLALPHGVAAEYARALIQGEKRVIDLSADFRLNSPKIYKEYYGHEHPDVDLLNEAPYVLPELADGSWKSARLIACPGCYPTSIQVPLVPLLRDNVIKTDGIIINACSGISGAGKKVAEDYLYCERNESMKAYGLPKHRHLSEIEEQLSFAAKKAVVVQFNPHLSPMHRGIATTIVVTANGSIEDLYASWKKQYEGKPFVSMLPSGTFPDTRYVSGTNRVDISAVYDVRTKNFVITSAIDNLVKGASGQAVQIMNLWNGFSETAGLV